MQPSGDYEEIEIRSAGGKIVRAIGREPEGDVRGSVVVVPSERSLTESLARRGYRAVGFDDAEQLPLVVECVRARADGGAVVVAGYADAAPLVVRAQARANADALVLLGGNVWRTARRAREYVQSARDVTVPVAAVVGTRDRLRCHPLAGAALARLCGGPVRVFTTKATHRGLLAADEALGDALAWAIAQARP